MAVNKDPFVRSRSKDGLPSMFKGLVNTGASQAIKVGEICYWSGTYFIPVSAVANHRYPLAISAEEQKATGRAELTAIRYIDFYSLAPEDEFEFELATAIGVALGDPYTLTASNSQKLTAGVGDFAVAICVDDGHYPQEEDTTIRSISHGIFSFNPVVSWWGFRLNQLARPGRKIITATSGETLVESDMYHSIILVTGAHTVHLPAVKPGMDAIFLSTGANIVVISPNASDLIRVLGAQLSDNVDIDNDAAEAAGDVIWVMTESASGFIALPMVSATWATV